jgi:catechol 2,3-dioxygenase-like lactoylglutathione lyase family enzyme
MRNIVRRTTLIVRDIARSVRWYEHVAGMTRFYDGEVVLSGKGMAAGKAGDRTHLVIMRCEDPDIGMIGLLQWVDPPLPAPAEIPTSVTYGNPTFVVATDDAREVLRRAQELGSHVHSGLHEWSVQGADGTKLRFLSVSVFDPDGYFYEFNQRLAPEELPEA